MYKNNHEVKDKNMFKYVITICIEAIFCHVFQTDVIIIKSGYPKVGDIAPLRAILVSFGAKKICCSLNIND